MMKKFAWRSIGCRRYVYDHWRGMADADDRTPQRFTITALDKKTGKVLWERAAHTGVPRNKRHINPRMRVRHPRQTDASWGLVHALTPN